MLHLCCIAIITIPPIVTTHVNSSIITFITHQRHPPFQSFHSELDQYLGVTLNTLIELLVRSRCIINVDLVRHDEARLGATRDDEIA
jgi:hypothetical protein